MKERSFLKISFVGIGNGINAVLGFLFLTGAARTLSISDFGKYALLSSLLVSLARIMDFGTNSLFVAQSITTQKDLKNTFISLKLILFFLTAIVSSAVLLLFKLADLKTLLIFLIGLIGYGINFTLFPLFQKKQQFHFAVALNTLPAIIKGAFGIMIISNLIFLNQLQIFGVFALSMLACTFLSFFLIDEFKNIKLSFTDNVEILKRSSPAGMSLLINEGWMAISNSIIKISKTFTDVGIFSLANKIANIFTLMSVSIFTVLLPKNAIRKTQKLGYDIKESVTLGAGILILTLIGIVVSRPFIIMFFGEKFAGSIDILNILIVSGAITAIHTFVENFFYIENRIKILFLIISSKLGLFLLLSFILIPIFSLMGLAYAHLVSAVYALLVTVGVVFKLHKNKKVAGV